VPGSGWAEGAGEALEMVMNEKDPVVLRPPLSQSAHNQAPIMTARMGNPCSGFKRRRRSQPWAGSTHSRRSAPGSRPVR
jgi:hypothetical protein